MHCVGYRMRKASTICLILVKGPSPVTGLTNEVLTKFSPSNLEF